MGPRPTMPPVESDNADSNEEAGNIRDTLIGCRRHMNEQTGGQHHRVKPPLNKFVMLPCFFSGSDDDDTAVRVNDYIK